ncbi:MAG: hypothetical protein HFH30_03935 [Eubacterium sp.]|nr:hypothetical protein [Eubacterium sp.]MCI8917316.1 hypothetical protein [Eubacterium sp.]
MSAKTRIVVLHMREVIYTAIFAALAILLILLLVFMFRSGKKDSAAQETMKYVSGVYTSSIVLNNQTMDLKVVVDDNRINAISLDNLDETAATMYPLMQPALDHISQQIYEKQSTENITYEEANQYTSVVLLNAIKNALSRAEVKEEGR